MEGRSAYFPSCLTSIFDRRRGGRAHILTSTACESACCLTYRYTRDYALERFGLLVLGLVTLEDTLDVRTENTFISVEGLEFLAEPGVEGARCDRHVFGFLQFSGTYLCARLKIENVKRTVLLRLRVKRHILIAGIKVVGG